tara:strand:+ start:710 stop:1633 length:924 start_codon:yes stop_codon:yes gene_type:complete
MATHNAQLVSFASVANGGESSDSAPDPEVVGESDSADITLVPRHCQPGENQKFDASQSVTIGLPFGACAGLVTWVDSRGKSRRSGVAAFRPYVVGTGVPHTLSWSGSVDLLVVGCEPSCWHRESGQEAKGITVIQAAEHDPVIWRLAALCRDLGTIQSTEDGPLIAYLGAALVRRLGQLLRVRPEHASKLRRLSAEQWEKVEAFVERQLKYDIQVADLAKQIGLGVGYFSELFKNTAGCAPFHYVKQRRMLRAHALLMQGPDNWRSVAALVGYSNSEHFSEVFKKFWGVAARNLLVQVNQAAAVRRH